MYLKLFYIFSSMLMPISMPNLVEYFSSLPVLIQQSIKELFIITVFDKYFII